jgi:hypothetical protein
MASWKRSLWDGSARDRLSAYFTPCIVFGKTRYRLDRISRHEDPLDLEDYRAMNAACCDCLFLCLPLGISSLSTQILRLTRISNSRLLIYRYYVFRYHFERDLPGPAVVWDKW